MAEAELEAVLDRYVLAVVAINPESRVKVTPGPARRELVEAGTRLFLVKVLNEEDRAWPTYALMRPHAYLSPRRTSTSSAQATTAWCSK